ncbi:MAG TPA: ATP-binding protein [Anditalea sp.]|nr:ATP-binding protein [Anditalea sp.]
MNSPNAQVYIVILAGIFLMLIMVVFVVFMVLVHRQKQFKNIQEINMLKTEYEKTILHVEKEIQEQTLVYVGQELHDNIGQMLSLAKLYIKSNDPEQLTESRALINQTIKEVRNLSKSLNINWVEHLSIKDFAATELAKIEKTGLCKTEMTFDNELNDLEKDKKIVLVRMIQETLNNSIKHAQPTFIQINLHRNENKVEVSVIDNGNGFDHQIKGKGMGLFHLHERMKSIGGRSEISSIIGKGTEIKLILPI